jgi:hypothetical protein
MFEQHHIERNRAEQTRSNGPVMAAVHPLTGSLPLTVYLAQTVERLSDHVQAATEFKKRLAPVSRAPEQEREKAGHPVASPNHCEMRAGLDELNNLLQTLEQGLLNANDKLELP